jgi:hypothetical protein
MLRGKRGRDLGLHGESFYVPKVTAKDVPMGMAYCIIGEG